MARGVLASRWDRIGLVSSTHCHALTAYNGTGIIIAMGGGSRVRYSICMSDIECFSVKVICVPMPRKG